LATIRDLTTDPPESWVGYSLRAADPSGCGVRLLSYDAGTGEFACQGIQWSTGRDVGGRVVMHRRRLAHLYNVRAAR
jgi:hypothetical protein